MSSPPPPFACTHTPSVPELLQQLRCSLAISTYQAGKVVLISPTDAETLVQLPRDFQHAMAMGTEGNRLAVATRDEVVVLAHEPGLAPGYPNLPATYDTLFAPRASYYTGRIDAHGLAWGKAGLWAVATSFSCLALVDDTHSFVPKWKPPFVTALASEDRCHLNGIALADGEPLYATAMGTGDELQSWRRTIPRGGVVMHVPSGEIVLRDLPMPHSPRIIDGRLFLLFSATGEVAVADPQRGTYEVIKRLSGFLRGLCRHGDYLFVGLSKLRQRSSTFKDLPIAKEALHAGVTILHIPTGAVVGEIRYQSTVEEIFDVQVLPGLMRPGILNTKGEVFKRALAIPGATFWARPKDEDAPGTPPAGAPTGPSEAETRD